MTGTTHLSFSTIGKALALLMLSACASKSVELVSEPAGAEVQTVNGEVLGNTPLVLKDDVLQKTTSSDGLLSVRFVGPGYLPQTLLVEVRGADTYRVQLVKLDETFFRKYILRDFSTEHNALVRDILNIQAMMRAKKYDEAEKALVVFQQRFPTIAVAQVMMANLQLVRGDRVAARRYLLQAQALDPTDPVVSRMLGSTNEARGMVLEKKASAEESKPVLPKALANPQNDTKADE
ncbi:MAG: hypothetical protein JST16_09030 [Bdellovibrionales bacterium]|nr:hypothetical protein [Bdellovibrionales bacterium]